MAMLKNSRLLVAAGAAIEWKDVSEDEKNEAYALIGAHNKSSDNNKNGLYFIDVSGKYQVYYTFWRWLETANPYVPNPIYMGNLSTNLVQAVKKAIAHAYNVPVTLESDETRHGLIGKTREVPKFTFGKYRGQAMSEVYLENPSYFVWLAKNADPKYADSKANIAIKFFADLYFKEMTKTNQETSTSKYVGQPGGKFTGELEIYKIEEKSGDNGPYTVFKLKDADDNKFLTYKLSGFDNPAVGQKINVDARIKDQKEMVGIKFNVLNYVKPTGPVKALPAGAVAPLTPMEALAGATRETSYKEMAKDYYSGDGNTEKTIFVNVPVDAIIINRIIRFSAGGSRYGSFPYYSYYLQYPEDGVIKKNTTSATDCVALSKVQALAKALSKRLGGLPIYEVTDFPPTRTEMKS